MYNSLNYYCYFFFNYLLCLRHNISLLGEIMLLSFGHWIDFLYFVHCITLTVYLNCFDSTVEETCRAHTDRHTHTHTHTLARTSTFNLRATISYLPVILKRFHGNHDTVVLHRKHVQGCQIRSQRTCTLWHTYTNTNWIERTYIRMFEYRTHWD